MNFGGKGPHLHTPDALGRPGALASVAVAGSRHMAPGA